MLDLFHLILFRCYINYYNFHIFQLRDIENNLDQKTKNLESIHHSISSNANSATEDVSVNGARPAPNSLPAAATGTLDNLHTTPGSPMHPSPRQHSLTMEGVQRIADKVAKHTRVEEAAVKRIRDLEMQVTQMRDSCVVSFTLANLFNYFMYGGKLPKWEAVIFENMKVRRRCGCQVE